MTDAEFDNYVKKRYEDQIAWYGPVAHPRYCGVGSRFGRHAS